MNSERRDQLPALSGDAACSGSTAADGVLLSDDPDTWDVDWSLGPYVLSNYGILPAAKVFELAGGPPSPTLFSAFESVRKWADENPDFEAWAELDDGLLVGCQSDGQAEYLESLNRLGDLPWAVAEPFVAVDVVDGVVHGVTPTLISTFRGWPTLHYFTNELSLAADPRTATDLRVLKRTADALGYEYVCSIAGIYWRTPDFPHEVTR